MLSKLLKYEWKSVFLMLAMIHVILLVYTLIGRIGLGFATGVSGETWSHSAANVFGISAALYILGYVLLMLAAAIATFFYLAVRMQRSLFSDEGYLTHTLPVTPAKLIWSKVLIFWAWTIIDLICLCLSVFLLFFSFRETFPDFFKAVAEFLNILAGSEGTEVHLMTILTILNFLTDGIYFTFLLIFSMCLGNLFNTHKVLGTVLSFFGLNIFLTIVQTLILLIPGMSALGSETYVTSASGLSVTVNGVPASAQGVVPLIFSLVWSIVLSVLFFLGSRYLLSKKLNLE